MCWFNSLIFVNLHKYKISLLLLGTGDILIAKPFLQDGFFKRSVIYLCEHNEDESLGFILNRNQELVLKDIFPHLKNATFPLFEGGPVSSNQLFYIHTIGKQLKDAIHIKDDVYWGGNFFELSDLIENNKIGIHQIRFFIGYSGWGDKQLEEELTADSWYTASASYKNLLQTPPADLWAQELTKINPSNKVFSDFSFDPSMN